MTLEQIEYLHAIEKMPDKYYYMQNGQSPAYNLAEQHQKIYKKARDQQEKMQLEKTIEKELDEQIEKELQKEFQKIFSKR